MLERYWQRLDVPEGATVFAPLRGKSLDMPWLVRAGYRVLGSELSPIAVRAFLHEQGLAAKVRTRGLFDVWEADLFLAN